MFSRLDNKKKWRIVGIIAFALAWPVAWGQAGVIDSHILRLAVCFGLPAISLWFLPFTQLVRGLAIIGYLFLMYPAANLFPPARDCAVGETCL